MSDYIFQLISGMAVGSATYFLFNRWFNERIIADYQAEIDRIESEHNARSEKRHEELLGNMADLFKYTKHLDSKGKVIDLMYKAREVDPQKANDIMAQLCFETRDSVGFCVAGLAKIVNEK